MSERRELRATLYDAAECLHDAERKLGEAVEFALRDPALFDQGTLETVTALSASVCGLVNETTQAGDRVKYRDDQDPNHPTEGT